MSRWNDSDIADLTGKRAVVTGGASGIGYEAARALAQHGAEVLVIDRDEPAGSDALVRIRVLRPDARLRFHAVDLGSQRSIWEFAAHLADEGKPLDLLINNAGIQPLSTRRTTADGFELTFGIGHLGHFALTGLLLPCLLKAPAPRVVTVSSMVHGNGTFVWDDLQMTRQYSSQRPYNQTKLANLLFAGELQRRAAAAGTGLTSVAVHPGVARTGIGSSRKNLGRLGMADHLVSLAIALAFHLPFLGQSAKAGALPTLFGAVSPEASGGGFYGPDGFAEMAGSPAPARIRRAGQDLASAKRLWEVSEALTGVVYAPLLASA